MTVLRIKEDTWIPDYNAYWRGRWNDYEYDPLEDETYYKYDGNWLEDAKQFIGK